MLQHLDLDNCLAFWLSATLCVNEAVTAKAIGLIGRHLEQISTDPQYLALESNAVESILSDDKLQVASEVQVYEAAMAWIKHDEKNRKECLCRLLNSIRLSLLPQSYLVQFVGTDELICENSDAMKRYSKALKVTG